MPEVPPPWQLMRLMDGFVTTQLLYVAAKLRFDEALAAGPRSGDEVAAAVGANGDAVTRVLRALAVEGVVEERDDGRFSLTEIGQALGPLRGMALTRGDVYFAPSAGLLGAVVEGGVSFDRFTGEHFFDYLSHHPDAGAAFHSGMAGRSEAEARDVVAVCDFGGAGTLVDVGGGQGLLLTAILRSAPELHGVLVDQEAALPDARARLADAGVADRAECVAGDFFVAVPSGGDTYLLSRVLHDWSDDDARRILSTCRAAMGAAARLLIVDAILPERAVDRPFAIRMDVHMMMLFGARERTEPEFRALLSSAGFALQRVTMTSSPAGLGVLEASVA